MSRSRSWLGSRKRSTLALQLLCTLNGVTAKNPKDNFCRIYGHQTTVINDKLYVDGGLVNFNDLQKAGDNVSSKYFSISSCYLRAIGGLKITDLF
jgi:hypothetical protein